MKRVAVPALSLAAGAAAGWFACLSRLPKESPVTAAAGTAEIRESTAQVLPAGQPPVTLPAPGKATIQDCRMILAAERNPMRGSAKILSLLDTMDKEAIAKMAGDLAATPLSWSDTQGSAMQELLLGKLTELDPDRALAVALKLPDMWGRMQAGGVVIQQLARTSQAAAEAALEKFPQGYLRKNIIAGLAASMAQTDGAGAVAMLQRLKSPPGDWAWGQTFQAWAGRDPSAAAAELLKMPRPIAQRSSGDIASAWAKRDPAGAMAWAASLTDPAMRSDSVSAAIGTIAQRDLENATALVGTMPTGERRGLMETLASSLSETDGPGAVSWAKTLTDPIERQRCLATVISRTVSSDQISAMHALAELPPGLIRNDAIAQTAGALAWNDMKAARAWVATLKPEEQLRALPSILDRLAASDPEEAERLAATLPPSGNPGSTWQRIAYGKALTDPAAAATWAGGLETEQARMAATGSVFQQWAGHSPEAAAKALGGIVDQNLRREAVTKLAEAWAGRSPAEATQWAQGLSGEDRITALATVWNASATDAPQQAGQSLAAAAAVPGSEATAEKLAAAAASIAGSWSGQSPTDAAAWATQLPEGKIREEALGGVADQWIKFDPESASKWIDGLPHDASRDVAVSKLVNHIARSDPESAFTWAGSVSGEEKRVEALKQAAMVWKNANPEAARAAVENASLPDAEKARVMEALR